MEMSASDFIVTKLREHNLNINEEELRSKLSKLDKDAILKLVNAVYKLCVRGRAANDAREGS